MAGQPRDQGPGSGRSARGPESGRWSVSKGVRVWQVAGQQGLLEVWEFLGAKLLIEIYL